MQINIKEKPRIFFVGDNKEIEIKDYGSLRLDNNEQVSLVTDSGNEYDICKRFTQR